MHRRHTSSLLTAAALLTFTAACSGSSSTAPHAGSTSPASTTGNPVITIRNFNYSAPSAPVHPGDRVTVINDDQAVHTLDADHGQWTSGDTSKGSPATFIAPAAGTYTFICKYHSFMHGTLVVR